MGGAKVVGYCVVLGPKAVGSVQGGGEVEANNLPKRLHASTKTEPPGSDGMTFEALALALIARLNPRTAAVLDGVLASFLSR